MITALLALGLAGMWVYMGQLNRELHTLRGQALNSAEPEDEAKLPSQKTEAESKPYERSARVALEERELPWPEVLAALEVHNLEGVHLRSFEADAAANEIRFEVTAPDHAQLLRFLTAMNQDTGHGGGSWSISLTRSRMEADGRVQGSMGARRSAR